MIVTPLLVPVAGLSAADFSVQTVDGLNRPISDVQVDIDCVSPQKNFSLPLTSDQNGVAHGTYDVALCVPLSVHLEKPGYQSYLSGFRSRYVLNLDLKAQDVARVAKLERESQLSELRELLAGGISPESEFRDAVLYQEARLRPALLTLAREPAVTLSARNLLATIAISEDLRFIMQLPPRASSPGFPERWRHVVATALVNPGTEDEWSFLRRCALNEFNDRWVDAGAIQSLKLAASPRSQMILEEAQQKNPGQASRIAGALDYIKSNPATIADANLEALAERIAQILKIGTWKGNGRPRFNEAGDKALVDFRFQTSEDSYVYTATFHRIDGVWTLRGAHETYQAFRLR
jgi:hypothetical protein